MRKCLSGEVTGEKSEYDDFGLVIRCKSLIKLTKVYVLDFWVFKKRSG
jgi:hypothetical protein